MNKYKIGDVVLIKQDVETTTSLTPEIASIMKKYKGKEATVTQTEVNEFLGLSMYKLDIDNGVLAWDESVLAPAPIEIGDRVRTISADEEKRGTAYNVILSERNDFTYIVTIDIPYCYVKFPKECLQKISNLESIQNNKNNVKNEEEEIMISDYRVEDCTIFDKTSGQGKHVKGKRTILEWTDGTVTTVECPDAEFNAYNGFAIALAKKAMGNDNTMTNLADFWINKLPAKNAKIQAEIEKCKAEERRIAEKRKAKKEKWQMRQAVLARKRAYEEAQKQRAVAEIAEREFGVPIDFKAE